jgi:hypothetical protein
VRRGLDVARLVADAGIGQAIVIKHGAVTAVEATEGTTETIRRGVAQAGPGAVIVKAAAREHDYRFDTPGVGPRRSRRRRPAERRSSRSKPSACSWWTVRSACGSRTRSGWRWLASSDDLGLAVRDARRG